MNIPWRAVIVLGSMACVNLAVFAIEYGSIVRDPRTGPEGIERALVSFGCVGVSVLLGGVGANQAIDNFRHGTSWAPLLLVSLFAAAPSVFYLFYELIPVWMRHHGY